ncbi:MAG: glycosyltransferase family 92 protein [Firmicutes bacterium]|nr:glycosyltransferase family 92 protein [Bacillota bacterium]
MKPIYKRRDELVIVSILKNEGPYIREWIEFYRLQGIDHFYLFDNESDDDMKSILEEYQDVTLIPIPGKAQIMAYNFALKAIKNYTKWIAFLDADEFLFPVRDETLKDILKEYEAYPGLGVNWVLYGPCGHEKKPKGLVMKSYTQTFKNRNHEMNCRIKSIVQPNKVLCITHPHTPVYRNGQLAVNEKKEVISGTAMYAPLGTACTMTNSIERLRINHYWTKSLEELKEKCDKGRSDGSSSLLFETTLKRLEGEKMEDTAILRFLPELKERLGARL